MSLSPRSPSYASRSGSASTRRSRKTNRRAVACVGTGAPRVEPLEGRTLLAVHLPAVADTFVRNNAFADANYGASPFLWVKTSTPGGGDSRIGFLKFNLGGLSAAEISSATLYLSGALQSPTTPPIDAGVYAVGDTSWQEGNGNVSVRRRGAAGGGGSQLTGTSLGDGYDTQGGVDWNTQPATADSPLATARIEGDTFNTYAFDVTQFVRSQAGGGGANPISLAVKASQATTAFMRFISSDFDGPGKPVLVVSRPNDGAVRTNIGANDITAGGGQTHTVVVSYHGDADVDLTKLDVNDIRVRRADGAPLSVINYAPDTPFNQASVNVTYFIQGPAGTWDRSDNGVYTIELPRGEAKDVAGDESIAALASFRVAIDDGQAPQAQVVASPVTAAGGNTYSFTVNYSDDTAIDAETININNVAVTAPDSSTLPVTQVTVNPDTDSGQITATYTVLAPGGQWDPTDTGTYGITVRNSQVRDTAGHDLSETDTTFQANIGQPDNVAPTASTPTANNVTAPGGRSHDVTVTYSDDVAIDVSSIDATDIVVSGPAGALQVGQPQVNQPTDGSPRTVTYPVTPPGGEWDATDNGTYTITVVANAVRDTSGHGVAAVSGSFGVNATGADPAPPSAALTSAPDVTAGGDRYSFTVTYSDNVAVKGSTIDGGDVTVTGPGGGVLQLTGVAANPANGADATEIAVTYTVAAPGGSWDHGDNGPYTITLNGNQVADTSGNAIAGPVQIGAFQVNVASDDNQRPTATISALPVTNEGAGIYSFTVAYSDNVGINDLSVGSDDVTVSGPGGGLAFSSTQKSAAGTDLTVTYFFTPPGGSWDAADRGTYTITVNDGSVVDTSGNGVVGRSQTFNVDVNQPDTLGPQAIITAPNVAVTGKTYTVTIKWQDDTVVRGATISPEDIVITPAGGGPALQVTGAVATPPGNAPSVNATYTVTPPGGVWDPSDRGIYVVTVVPEQVQDGGNHNAQSASTTFDVNVADNGTPTATISAPNIDTASGEREKIVVTYTDDVAIDVSTIEAANLSIVGPGGVGTLVPIQVTQTEPSNAPSVVVTYEVVPPGGTWDVSDNGVYTITINPNSVKDAAGNAVTGSGTFTVGVADEPGPGPAIAAGFTIEGILTQQGTEAIVLVGRRANPSAPGTFQAVLQRRNPDGSLDTTFGNGGSVFSDPATNSIYYAVVQTNNGFVVAGTQDGHWLLARYDLSGRPDANFGTGGTVVTSFGRVNETAYALAVDPRNGMLVVGGSTPADSDPTQTDQNFAFARYSPNGGLDTSFNQTGLQVLDINGEDVVGAVTVLADGSVVAAGSSGAEVSVFRLLPNGNPDPAFSGDGYLALTGLLQSRVETDPFFVDHSQALAIQNDKILVGNHNAAGDFAVVRIDSNGNVDSSFGNNGVAAVDFGGQDDVDSLVLQPTGEILAVGTTNTGIGGAGLTAVAALDDRGALITGWNQGGKLTFAPEITSSGRELHVGDLVLRAFGTRQSDGRLVVGSSDRTPTPTSSAFRKISVPGITRDPAGEHIGDFGIVGTGRGKKFTFTDDDGTVVTFSLKGNAVGRVFKAGDTFNLRIEDLSGGSVPCVVVIKGKGGDRRVKIGDLTCTGALKGLTAKTADLSGTMYVRGSAGKLALGDITGTVATAGMIGSLSANSLTNAKVLSGAQLGGDGQLGGTAADADIFDRGFIGSLKVAKAITGSIVAAGLKPVDEVIGNDNDVVVGGAGTDGGPFSIIRSISAKGGADDTTHFIAGGFGVVKLPKRVDPTKDPQARFTTK